MHYFLGKGVCETVCITDDALHLTMHINAVSLPLILAHGGASPVAAIGVLFAALIAAPISAVIAATIGLGLRQLTKSLAPRSLLAWFRLWIGTWFFCTLSLVAVCGS